MKGQTWPNIPALIWPEGIDEAASDWLRALVIELGVATSSAREYAKIIRPFLRYCRETNTPWDVVDDDFLIRWREHLRRSEGVSTRRVNASLRTVFAFYRWAEENKRLHFRVGIYSEDELPHQLASISFPISAQRTFSKGRNGKVYGSWKTPLTLSQFGSQPPPRNTPTETQIRDIHEIAATRLQGERDSLMFSWAEEAGPRRAEFLSVRKSQLPSNDQLINLIELDEPWIIKITQKGGSSKALHVQPDLIIRTLDYVNFGRDEIVKKCRRTIVGYREPEEIFLSSRSGLPLHPDSVTSLGRRTFQKAGVERANIHRLRARFAVRTVETLVEAMFDGRTINADSIWVETILLKAAEVMGHSSPRSLRPYLTYVLNRRLRNADAMKANKTAERVRQLSLQEATLVHRLHHQSGLQSAAGQIQAGKFNEAADILRQIIANLENRKSR